MAALKRKISTDDEGSSSSEQPNKKKSPLFNQPQNYYAPSSISNMSKDELSEWRKEQRRKRNRESAAASRNKTRARIDELEGEVNQWKNKYADLEMKMRCMERHIQFLIATSNNNNKALVVAPPATAASPPPMVSNPNSPPRSPQPHGMPVSMVVPNSVPSSSSMMLPPPPSYSSHNIAPAAIGRTNTNPLFPKLLSEAKVFNPQVEKHEAIAAVVATTAVTAASIVPKEESRKHLITSISRHA